MNVYLTTGRKNYKYAYVAIKSLFENNRNSEIYLYIVSEDLEESDLKYEYELAEQYHNHIIIVKFDEKAAAEHISFGKRDHWAVSAMSSYWIFHGLLPQEVDRIIAIESDTVIVGDLSEIYNIDFEDNYVICPGPEHKPKSHRNFMEQIGGECLTFVLSIYNIKKIRQDFSLNDILNTDAYIRKLSGSSMMELTFGLLFRGKIKFILGPISCIDENERYMEELGYEYVIECEKTAKIIHFSSYGDYSKPWNPVFLVPGYHRWWVYAADSPYYKDYIEMQWMIYNNTRKRQGKIARNISYRNVLLCTIVIMVIILMTLEIVVWSNWLASVAVAVSALVSTGLSWALRWGMIKLNKMRKYV